jgi:beta-mannosidase
MPFFYKHIIINLLLICIAYNTNAQLDIKESLMQGWKLRNVKQTSWMDVTIPTTVQQELIKRKMAVNPFWGNQEKDIAWIEKENWEFALYFDASPSMMNQKFISLVLEGIDNDAIVKLNGVVLGNVNNMHRTWKFEIKNILSGSSNCLSIEIIGTQAIADTLAKQSLYNLPTDNRAFSRKAAYQFGWDFAPRILSMGIIKPIYIIGNNKPISIYPTYTFIEPIAKLDLDLFQFSVNGKPTFVKGINIVPASAMMPVADVYYDSLIAVCKNLNINMLRVWGGGTYPSEHFYNLCDENKIMVWQDFMFANLLLPINESMKTNVIKEVEDGIRKLRHHSCIVLWCGNNEINEGWQNWGWQKKYSVEEKSELWRNYLQFFETEIPNLVKIWDDARPYISSSPKHGWGKSESLTEGDAHYWGVWWGKEPIANFWYKVPRFMSEYGMQAMPDIHTVLEFCEPHKMVLTDSAFTNHQKHPTGFETLRHYLQQYPQHKDSLGYIYFTQLLQRDALETAISAHRSAFPYCNGTMPWQLNDVWPAISWSIIDFYNRPKASYYAIQKLYAKNAITLGKFISQDGKNIVDTNKNIFALSICEPTYDITNMKTTFSVVDFYGDVMYKTNQINWQKTEGGNYFTTDFFEKNSFQSYNWAMAYLLVDITNKDGLDIHKVFYFDAPKNLKLQPTNYDVQWVNDTTIKIESLHLAKDVYIYATNPKVTFSDNYFNLLPTEQKLVTVHGWQKDKDKLKVYSQIDMINE